MAWYQSTTFKQCWNIILTKLEWEEKHAERSTTNKSVMLSFNLRHDFIQSTYLYSKWCGLLFFFFQWMQKESEQRWQSDKEILQRLNCGERGSKDCGFFQFCPPVQRTTFRKQVWQWTNLSKWHFTCTKIKIHEIRGKWTTRPGHIFVVYFVIASLLRT